MAYDQTNGESNQPDAEQPPAMDPNAPIQLKPGEGQDQDLAERATVEALISQFDRWSDWRRPLETIWQTIYRLYMGRPDRTKLSTRSHVVIPKAFQIVETGVAKLMSIITGQTPIFEVVKRFRFQTVSQETLENVKALLDYQLDLAGFVGKFAQFVKQLVMYGTSYFYVTWKVRREWVYERVPVRKTFTLFGMSLPSFDLQWETKLVYKVVERRPEIDVLSIDDVYPDPDATDVQNGRGLYVFSRMPMSEFKELTTGKFPVFTNYEKVAESSGTRTETDFQQAKQSIRGTGDPKPAVGDKNMVELLTFWGKRDIDGDGIAEEVCIVIANKAVLVKCRRNPFEHQKRPLVKGVMFPVVNEWYGMGLVEPIIPMTAELDTLHNQQIDMNNLIINRMWKVDPTADVDITTLKSLPNGIVLATPLDSVVELKQDPLPFSPTQLMGVIESEIDNTTAPKAVQGTPENGSLGRTARGAHLIISQAMEKFATCAKLLEDGPLKGVLTMFHQLDAQFLDSDESLQDKNIYGYVFPSKPTPEQIRSNVDFKMLGLSETVAKESTFNQIVAYVNTFAPFGNLNLIGIARVAWDMVGTKLPSNEAVQEVSPLQMMLQGGGQQQSGQPPMGGSAAVASQVQTNGAGGPIATTPQG